jgi:hypothetical protein
MTRRNCLVATVILDMLIANTQARVEWSEGNTHTNTINSVGDSTLDDVARWYRLQGYDFLFITDHDIVTDVDPLSGGRLVPSRFADFAVLDRDLLKAGPTDILKIQVLGTVVGGKTAFRPSLESR